MSAAHDELKHAHDELKAAAQVVADRILGAETRGHLRQAARHVLKAGLAALDEGEKSCAAKTVVTTTV
jgi:hypothetical protein